MTEVAQSVQVLGYRMGDRRLGALIPVGHRFSHGHLLRESPNFLSNYQLIRD
jgi:hypothetical protein